MKHPTSFNRRGDKIRWLAGFCLLIIPLSSGCSHPTPPSTANAQTPTSTTSPAPITIPEPMPEPGWHRNLSVDGVPYDLYIPANYRSASLLVLPGWNYERSSWVDNAPLVDYANKYGYALILPEMLVTLYESAYYPETTLKWQPVPGGKFIKERLIPEIQKQHNLLLPGQYNTLLGLSTGGRGVALIALENPGLFAAGASLSGDFSQENTPDDRLMTAVYGAFSEFPQRWLGRDNPQARAAEWMMPLYLAHGIDDEIVPESQSRLFYYALRQRRGDDIVVEYHAVPGAAHDYEFWGGQLPSVFEFFEKVQKSS